MEEGFKDDGRGVQIRNGRYQFSVPVCVPKRHSGNYTRRYRNLTMSMKLCSCEWIFADDFFIVGADEYFFSRLPIVETRLAQGGVRLAAILNRLFSGKNALAL